MYSVAESTNLSEVESERVKQKQYEALVEIERDQQVEFRGEIVAAWIFAAVAFGAAIGWFLGAEKAEEYFAGYLLEQSLSVDNLFVFILVFKYFRTPLEYQSKVLNYGFITAGILRLIMIVLGVELIESFNVLFLVFAALLVYSSLQLLLSNDDDDEDLTDNAIVRFCSRVMQVSDSYDGNRFFTVENGVKMATPLLLTLAVVELSDVVFAVDSVPAVFGVTLDPFIIYTSNLFAILSLRSFYGFISVVMSQLRFLDKSVAVVLGFIGVKMAADFIGIHVSTDVSLIVVGVVLFSGVTASALFPADQEEC
eukprot:g1117.t1